MPTRRELANAIRVLAMDAVEHAKSGHPGAPMGMAPMAYAVWMEAMKHNPKNPAWRDRERFVLSSGHARACPPGRKAALRPCVETRPCP